MVSLLLCVFPWRAPWYGPSWRRLESTKHHSDPCLVFEFFFWGSQARPASTVFNAFRPVRHTVAALYFGSDFANLEVLHVSHAVDHFLGLLAEWIERVILLQVGLQRFFGCVSNWWINFWTASLRVWWWSWTVEWSNLWILKSVSPRQLSLYVHRFLCACWNGRRMFSKLVVCWRPKCKFGFCTILCGTVGAWYVWLYTYSPNFLITTFTIHTAGKVLWRMIALDLFWFNCNPSLWATFKLTNTLCFDVFSNCVWTLQSWASSPLKNTACLPFLTSLPPGINPDWMIECRSWELPTW